ncbi:MAG: alkaline phosphatase family protein [Polyangiaceae bacterium]
MAKGKRRAQTPGTKVKRRTVLGGIGGALGGAALGCSESPDTAGPSSQGSATTGVGASGGEGAAAVSSTSISTSSSGGQSGQGGAGGGDNCSDSGGLSAEQLLAKIDTFVVLCMENRSFDHYFGSLALLEGKLVDGLTGNEVNVSAGGKSVSPFHLLDQTPADPAHDWDPVHAQWNDGQMDGFVAEHEGAEEEAVMGYYVREQLNALYQLVDAYTVCDRWFCSVLGPTWPNRFYLHGASSEGKKGNSPIFGGFDNVFQQMEDANLSSTNYFHDIPWCAGAYFKATGNSGIENFFEAAAEGTLPRYSLIDPQFFGGGANDDHPDHDIALGQALIASVYQALAQSEQWEKTLFIITYDEHGGFFDHVPPPATIDANPEFAQLGMRVPAVVISPFARKGCAVSQTFEHSTVASTLAKRYGFEPINARAAATSDISPCIDPKSLDRPRAPAPIDPVPISMSALRRRMRQPRRIHQPELWEMARLGMFPRHLDRRHRVDEITATVLEHGRRLGAVRLID